MTVDPTSPIAVGFGNGTTTVWPFAFRIDSPADLVVIRTEADGSSVELTEAVDYAVTGTFPGSGAVTYPIAGAPLPAGAKLTRLRRSALEQTVKIRRGGDFSGPVVENMVDRAILLVQEHDRALTGALRLPDHVTGVDARLPAPAPGKTIRWNATADALEAADDPGAAEMAAAASAVAAATSAGIAVASAAGAAASEANAVDAASSAASSANAAAAAAGSGRYATIVDVTTLDSPVTIPEANDGALYEVDSAGGAVVLNLPDLGLAAGDLRVGVVRLSADANAVTVQRQGSDLINGNASLAIGAQFQVINLAGNKSAGQWVASDVTAAGLTGGDGIAVAGGIIAADLDTDAGLDFSAGKLRAKTDGATLETTAAGLAVKPAGVGTPHIADGAVDNAKLAAMAEATLKGRAGGAGAGAPQDLTPSQARSALGLVIGSDVEPFGTAVRKGKFELPVGVAAVRPEEINGCGLLEHLVTDSNGVNIPTRAFLDGADQSGTFILVMPKSWDRGPIEWRVLWLHDAAAGNFTVRWAMEMIAVGDGDSIDASGGGSATAVDDVGGVAETLYRTGYASTDPVNSEAEGDLVHFRIRRLGTHANDTLAATARLAGLQLRINYDQDNDD